MGRLNTKRVDVAIVGGGAQGLCIAIEIARSGRRVAVFDRFGFNRGASHGNAGLLCPSYVTPIASPRALSTALGWLARGEGPFSLARPPWQSEMVRWLARFLRACCSTRRSAITRLLADLAARSIEWYTDFATDSLDFSLRRDGWLYVYATQSGLAEGLRHASSMRLAGVLSSVLSASDAVMLEPSLRTPVGAIHYPGDAHVDPSAFIAAAAERARILGVELMPDTIISDISSIPGAVRIRTAAGETSEAGYAVIACGAETPRLAGKVGATLPILPARGHSASLPSSKPPRLPLLLAEAHLVMTPMPGRVRMTSGLELGSWEQQPDPERLKRMASDAGRYLSGDSSQYSEAWVGFRPLTPDGLPVVGPLSEDARIIVASGHGTLGMTLAPATAYIVRDIVDGKRGPAALSPTRFAA